MSVPCKRMADVVTDYFVISVVAIALMKLIGWGLFGPQSSWVYGLNIALGMPVAAGVLYPLTGWLLSPLIAALAMSFSSVSVIGNAIRLHCRSASKQGLVQCRNRLRNIQRPRLANSAVLT